MVQVENKQDYSNNTIFYGIIHYLIHSGIMTYHENADYIERCTDFDGILLKNLFDIPVGSHIYMTDSENKIIVKHLLPEEYETIDDPEKIVWYYLDCGKTVEIPFRNFFVI